MGGKFQSALSAAFFLTVVLLTPVLAQVYNGCLPYPCSRWCRVVHFILFFFHKVNGFNQCEPRGIIHSSRHSLSLIVSCSFQSSPISPVPFCAWVRTAFLNTGKFLLTSGRYNICRNWLIVWRLYLRECEPQITIFCIRSPSYPQHLGLLSSLISLRNLLP